MRHRIRAALYGMMLLAGPPVAAPAGAQVPSALVGWWIAIDDVFPPLRYAGGAIEELMLVAPDGAVESRAMRFRHPSAAECTQSGLCSDAPLLARARMTIEGAALSFATTAASGVEPSLAGSAATATATWTLLPSKDPQQMRLHAGERARLFARVEPDRLRRWRAGFLVAAELTKAVAAQTHWRCYLARVSSGQAAFSPLRTGKTAAPTFLPDYLRIASYRSTLAAMGGLAPAGDRAAALELLLVEPFKDAEPPRTAADAVRYRAQVIFIDRRATNASPQEADVVATAANGGRPVTVAATGAEFAALARVRRGDAEAKQLFCRE